MSHTLLTPLLAGLAIATAWADETRALGEVVIRADTATSIGVADAASEGSVGARELANRPLLRPAEVLETVPGMIVTQHSGDGKANQYFLRGFNLDHGSDFSTRVMGMPVNMVSHAHGQGYMDLNFLIPELVGNVKYRKGVYAAEDGDFTTAGSARIDYQRQLARPFADLSLGEHGYRRLLTAGSREINGFQLLGALELAGNDGPWEQPENLKKTNAVLRLAEGTAANGLALTALAYRADWTATEHVPQRAIDSGEIGRFGALSPHDGGQTHRYSLSGEWAKSDANGASKGNFYVIDYGLKLFSAPSGFINGAAGDQHEQADQRTVWGGEARRAWFLGPDWKDTEIAAGLQLRQDRIGQVGLYRTENRRRTATVREDRVLETATALFLEARSQWTPWLRSTLGLRRDEIAARVTALGGEFNTANGDSARAGQTSPRLGVVLGPFQPLGATEFYGNWGEGFHSNDARGATSRVDPANGNPIDKVPLLVKARGSEIGLRAAPLPGWESRLALWQMDLASELVFIGDEGVTEPKGASRRHGLEWSNHLALRDGLFLDGDLALSQARFRDDTGGGREVPNAVPLTASLALSADPGGRWFGGLRLRYLGAYALEESGREKSTPFWLANLKLGYRISPDVQLSLDVLNLFDRKANDIEYWGGACTRNELNANACGNGTAIDGRLVHPLEPRTLRLGLRIGF